MNKNSKMKKYTYVLFIKSLRLNKFLYPLFLNVNIARII